VDKYEVQLPPGIWYDYWTGKRIDRSDTVLSRDAEQKNGAQASAATQAVEPLIVEPSLAVLPVYVRGGTILPMEPLTQSTEEMPIGPLTLRVYAGDDCKGTLYQDDGKSYDFKRGQFLRMENNCSLEHNVLSVHVGRHEGSYKAWWSEITVEVYGWTAPEAHAKVGDQTINATRNSTTQAWHVTIPDNGNGMLVTFE
jgi:alpha-glucosidase